MKDIEKEFKYMRLSSIHNYYNHRIRGWLYDKLSKYYARKVERGLK